MTLEPLLGSTAPYRADVSWCVGAGTHAPEKRICVASDYRDTSLIRKRPPSQDPPRTLGIGLRWGPRGVRFLMSEVTLYWLGGAAEGGAGTERAAVKSTGVPRS